MQGKARILIYGFTAEEGQRIDAALTAAGVPAPARLRPTQGQVVLSDILEHDRDGTEALDVFEPLVLFYNVSEAGIRTLIPLLRGVGVSRPIFAMVTESSYRWTLARLLEHLLEERRAVEQRSAESRPEGPPAGGPAGGSPSEGRGSDGPRSDGRRSDGRRSDGRGP